MDETGYCTGSALLLEGLTPGNKAAPGGPLMWAGWAYLGGETVWDLVHPSAAERGQSLAVRPFTAVDRVLFDTYRDISSLHRVLVVINGVLAVVAALAAAGLGWQLGGTIGGLILGVLVAGVPVFLDHSEMSRPYSMAWSFGIVALYFASLIGDRLRRGRYALLAAIFLGLSIGSRIEMLCVIPLVWWVIWELDVRRRSLRYSEEPGVPAPDPALGSTSETGVWFSAAKITLLSLCIAIWVAPWLMTHLIGNLRTIATVRFGGNNSENWSGALRQLVVNQGLGPVILLAIFGLVMQAKGTRVRFILPTLYTLLLSIAMLIGFADGVHQHGAVLIGWFILAAAVAPALLTKWPRTVAVSLAAALVFPLVMSALQIRFNHQLDDHEDAVAWIEQHVPAGTTVYAIEGGERTLLPTPEASAALWSEVTDDQAWRKKMESGLSRFKLSAGELPRALSEENLVQERANRRKWFILGGRTDLPVPRYDVRVVLSSPVFGIHDLNAAMKSHGGVLIWRDGFHVNPPEFLGQPVMKWESAKGTGVWIYATDDVREKIRDRTF